MARASVSSTAPPNKKRKVIELSLEGDYVDVMSDAEKIGSKEARMRAVAVKSNFVKGQKREPQSELAKIKVDNKNEFEQANIRPQVSSQFFVVKSDGLK